MRCSPRTELIRVSVIYILWLLALLLRIPGKGYADQPLDEELRARSQSDGLSIMSVGNRHWTAFLFDRERPLEHDMPLLLFAEQLCFDGLTVMGQSDDSRIVRLRIDGPVQIGCQIPISAGTISVAPQETMAVIFGRAYAPGHKERSTERAFYIVSGLWNGKAGCDASIRALPIETGSYDVTKFSVSWSPDGGAFTYNSGGHVWVYDLSKGASRVVADGEEPRWAPDGKWISLRGPGGQACLLSLLTGERHQILKSRPIRGALHWSPDSQFLFFCEKVSIMESILHGLASQRFVVYRIRDGATKPVFWTFGQISDAFYDWALIPQHLR